MLGLTKTTNKKDPQFAATLKEVAELSDQIKEHERIESIPEQRKFLKLRSRKVTGKELNVVTSKIDDNFIKTKNVQIETLKHITQLYQALDALDSDHIAGILSAAKAAETASNLAQINDENIGKIISYLTQNGQILAYRKEQDKKIADLTKKLSIAFFIAIGSIATALLSLLFALLH